MSIYEASSVAIAALGLLISTIVLLLLVWQIRLLRQQVSDARQAITNSTAATRLDAERLSRQATMAFVSATYGSSREIINRLPPAESPVTDKYVESALFTGSPEFTDVRNYLNNLEDLCAGANMGIFDFETVDRLSGGRLARAWAVYRPWIEQERAKLGPELFIELEIFTRNRQIRKGPDASAS